jgi:hypothetical protein
MKIQLFTILALAALSASDLPDPTITPGASFPNVTKEQLCVHGYTGTVRDVNEAEKEQVFKNYGLDGNHQGYCDVKRGCEVDHLISLELGGSNDIKNLWPQAYTGRDWSATKKDRLENKLHSLICSGEISIEDAQREISTNWIEAYKKHVGDK